MDKKIKTDSFIVLTVLFIIRIYLKYLILMSNYKKTMKIVIKNENISSIYLFIFLTILANR